MVDEAEDLFVIDKKGAEESQPSNIVYYFKSEEEQQRPEPSSEAKPVRQRRGPVGKRYHEADDFNKFRPGHLSRELRRALNLDRHEIPVHVYRMRSLGYPPGWLRKARVGGGLMIFDSVTALAENEEVTYNREALICYPGFNAQLEYPYVDQSVQLHCPPMQSHHMLDNFYAALSRSSQWNLNGNNAEVPRDLEKLREERERILAEIRLLDSKITVSRSSHETEDAELQSDPEDKKDNAGQHSSCTSQKSPNSSSCSTTEVTQSDSNSGFGGVDRQLLSISAAEEGTPTPQRFHGSDSDVMNVGLPSEPLKRPSIDAFTVGVQPFRPFENLPGSQGGYQRVLQTLRLSRSVKSPSTEPSYLMSNNGNTMHEGNNRNGTNSNNNNINNDDDSDNGSGNNNNRDRRNSHSSKRSHFPSQYGSGSGYNRDSGFGRSFSSPYFRGDRSRRYDRHY